MKLKFIDRYLNSQHTTAWNQDFSAFYTAAEEALATCGSWVLYDTTSASKRNQVKRLFPGWGIADPVTAATPELEYFRSFFFSFLWVVGRMLKSSSLHKLRQLFLTEMCKRETKNRTHTPLSQLPLHCLWDCLCVSPLFSFKVPVSSLPPSLFSHFLSSWISPRFPGKACAATKDLKQDTTSPDYGPLGTAAKQVAGTVSI